jgi:protein gp37
MSETKIEWVHPPGFDAGETWNATLGCSKQSPGCKKCYAIRSVRRMSGNPNAKIAAANAGLVVMTGAGLNWTGKINLIEERLHIPLRKRRPTCWFVNSLSDLFHPEVPDDFIDRVFAVMALCPHHRFIILTKQAQRMFDYFAPGTFRDARIATQAKLTSTSVAPFKLPSSEVFDAGRVARGEPWEICKWPLPNIWLGVSAENQKYADERIPLLLKTPATKRIVSYEPALGLIDFDAVPVTAAPGFFGGALRWHHRGRCHEVDNIPYPVIDQVLIGGESGPDSSPFDIGWARSTRDQCKTAGTAFFMKQMGSHPVAGEHDIKQGGVFAGARHVEPKYDLCLNDKKGGRIEEWPSDLQIREYPT